MSARQIRQHYGFGAARISIRAEMHRVCEAGFREDFDAILAEAGSGGPGEIARRFAGAGLGLLTIVGFLGFVIAGLANQEAEREALEVVMLETTPPPLVVPARLPLRPSLERQGASATPALACRRNCGCWSTRTVPLLGPCRGSFRGTPNSQARAIRGPRR